MKFSVWPSPSRSTDEVLKLARTADASGWFGFWFADHYMPNTGDDTIEAGDVHEIWSILPAVAATTESIRIGSLVSPTSVHHPAVLANRATTLDHVSHGRMVLGLGAGWQINEHRAYGIELEPPKERVDRFEESIQVIRSLLDEDRTTFAGTYYSIDDAPSDPSPVQAKLPILVGTSGPRMCRITANHAQEWNAWGPPNVAAQKVEVFSAACERVDVDMAGKHMSVQAL
ncbi:MAG: alkanesulfonate monooxygenase SsuD, partial [Verrucomicrobiales bacterium]